MFRKVGRFFPGAGNVREVYLAEGSHPTCIRWTYRSFSAVVLPFFLFCVRLRIDDTDVEVEGHGHSFSYFQAKKIALSEAWERAVFKYRYNYGGSAFRTLFSSSSGIAAHPNLSEAKRQAFEELVERKIFRDGWAKGSGWKTYILRGLRAKMLYRFAERLQMTARFYVVRTNLSYDCLVGAFITKDGSLFYDSILIDCDVTADQRSRCEEKLLMSLISDVVTRESSVMANKGFRRLPFDRLPAAYSQSYSQIQTERIFDDLCRQGLSRQKTFLDQKDLDSIRTLTFFEGESMPSVVGCYQGAWKKPLRKSPIQGRLEDYPPSKIDAF